MAILIFDAFQVAAMHHTSTHDAELACSEWTVRSNLQFPNCPSSAQYCDGGRRIKGLVPSSFAVTTGRRRGTTIVRSLEPSIADQNSLNTG